MFISLKIRKIFNWTASTLNVATLWQLVLPHKSIYTFFAALNL